MRSTSLGVALFTLLVLLPGVVFAQGVSTAAERRAAHYDRLIADLISPSAGESRVQIAEALGEAGEDAVPKILQLLEHPDDRVAQYGCVALSRMRGKSSAAIPRLSQIVRTAGHPIRSDAALALIFMYDGNPLVIEVLSDVVRTESDFEFGLTILRGVRTLPSAAVPVYAAALQNPSRDIRMETMLAFEDMDEDFSMLADMIVSACDENDLELCRQACDSLVTMGSAAEPALVRLAAFHQPTVRQWALAALVNRRTVSDDSLSAFVQAAQDRDEAIRFWAAKGLGFGAHRQDAIDGLLVLASDSDDDVRWQAIQSLGRLESQADGVAECLRSHLRDNHPAVQLAAAMGVWRITGDTEQPREVLRQLARTPNSSVGKASLAALRQLEAARR